MCGNLSSYNLKIQHFESTVHCDLVANAVEQTNLYANRHKNKPAFNVSIKEMINFIGLMFLSGYNNGLLKRDVLMYIYAVILLVQ